MSDKALIILATVAILLLPLICAATLELFYPERNELPVQWDD